MDEQQRTELARLKTQQARLETELKALSEQLRLFEARSFSTPQPLAPAAAPSPATQTVQRSALDEQPAQPAMLPPPLLSTPAQKAPAPVSKPAAEPVFLAGEPVEGGSLNPSAPAPESSFAARPAAPPVLPSPPHRVPASQPAAERSFEMRLGTFWLVRIGMVMVLTGLVFFGNLAYQRYVSKLGPGGKVSLLYLASGLFLAGGWWWQRKAVRDTVRNYGQVLFAGGLAALYFTTYAAHHLDPLRIISSALLDGVLLLVCAGLMVWAAERKKSEVLAFFAVGLAYYTSIITRVGSFTLWSNLVLSGTAVFFLVRNRWAALSFASLLATYGGYGYWRFFNGTEWHWATPEQGLWTGAWFLFGYWAVFTSAVFLSRDQKFAGANRAGFLTLNNSVLFSLFLLTMVQVHQGGFWEFALVYGAVLSALAALAERVLPGEPSAANSYLTQGLLLVTVGFISKFAGLQLALVLATESVLLVMTGQLRKNWVLLTGGYIAGALAVGWALDGLQPFAVPQLWMGAGVGLVMLLNSWLCHRRCLQQSGAGQGGVGKLLRPQPSYFTVLALLIWVATTWHNTARDTFPLALGIEAVLLTASVYILGIQEVALFGQGMMLLGLGAWFVNWLAAGTAGAWWNPALMILLNLILSHWWPRQKIIHPKAENQVLWPALYSLGICFVIYLWLAPRTPGPAWLVTTSLLAVGLTVYGVATRAWFVACFAQLFLFVAVAQFGFQLLQTAPPWRFPLAPIAALGLLSFGTVQWFVRKPASDPRVREPLLQAALIYRWVGLAMSVAWICEYIPSRQRIWVLSLLGLALFLWSGRQRNREMLCAGAVFTATALVLFWQPLLEAPVVYFPDLIAILVLLFQRQLARRMPERFAVDAGIHNAVILVGGLSLWLFVSRWVLEVASGFYLTASWSALALALFTAGLMLRERMYRWLGLGVLACALGRVVLFDVWKLETAYRVLSFMALGIVLLVLGFIYSKYQEKIKEWL